MVFILACCFSSHLHAQSPSQGPPPPPLPGVPNNELGTFLIINQVKTSLQTAVDTINAVIDRKKPETGVDANLGFSYKLYKPGMSVSTYTDQPNFNMVRMSFSVEFNITGIRYHGIPYFGRKMFQNIEVNITCKNWFNPPGHLNVAVKVDRPYLDNASFAEQALNFFFANTFTDIVDSRLKQMLPAGFSTMTNIPNSDCSCLGVLPGTAPNYTDGSILYSYKKIKVMGVTGASINNTVTITPLSIKRLNARSLNGEVLYAPSENIEVELYGNHVLRVASLTDMKEGDTRSLGMQPIVLDKPGNNGMIVLIGNITQQSGSYIKESRYAVFKKAQNFGNGTQKLIIQKSYWTKPQRLPGGGMTKPTEVKVNAYEITIQVAAQQLAIGTFR